MKIIKKIFSFKKSKDKILNNILDREYFFDNYKIMLDKNHILDEYQNSFPLYDRFLPILCSDFDGLIIDVGANIGDTAIAIFSKNSKSFIVGVEADKGFYEKCMKNVFYNKLTHRFLGVNKFLSTKSGKYSLEKSDTLSTGSIVVDSNLSGEVNTISFSELMNLIPIINRNKFDILKIDTDGYDWDIINSFTEYAKKNMIIPRFVFFEMQTYLNNEGFNDRNRDEITQNYKAALEKLNMVGYNNFCLIDNFGTPIKITKSICEILELNDYIKRSQVFNSHSTIYYMDILAFSEDEIKSVNKGISNLYKII